MIIDELKDSITKFRITAQKYQFQGTFVEDDKVAPSMFPDLIININEVFKI